MIGKLRLIACGLCLLLSTQLRAQIQSLLQQIEEHVHAEEETLIDIYKDLHANPELAFTEIRTAGIIAQKLKSFGYRVQDQIGVTGVVGILENGPGPIVMYRAEMDCNSVKETTNLPYASKKKVKLADGSETFVAHMCGHDAHVTWMIGAAKFLSENKSLWKGTVIFVGQPAEEVLAGAEKMIEDGLYTKYAVPEPDYLLSMHTSTMATGTVVAASGVRLAGSDQLDVEFKGIGGHGSVPYESKNPILMGATAINAYQQIISKSINPQSTAVVAVGAFQSGIDNNVVPASALVKLNLRWFRDQDRKTILREIELINEGIAIANDLSKDQYPTITMKGSVTPLKNDTMLTELVRKSLKNLIKDGNIYDESTIPSIMGSEDVHHLIIHNNKGKYSFIFVGVAEPARSAESAKDGKAPFKHHEGNFEVDLNAISFGTKIAIHSLLGVFNKTIADGIE